MAEIDALGRTRGAGGIEGGGHGVLVEIREVVIIAGAGQQRFVFAVQGQGSLRVLGLVADEDDLFDRFELVLDGFQQRQELRVDQDEVVLGMVDGVD